MATIFQNNTEEEEQPTVAGAPTDVTPTGAPTSAPTGISRPQKGSGRVTNLQQYIQANRGLQTPTGGLAGGIQQQAQQKAEQLGQELSTQQQQFGQQAGQLQEQLGEQAEQTIQTAFKDPSQILQQQQQLEQFQQLRDKGLQQQIGQLPGDITPLQQRQQALQQQAQQAGTEAGRFQLLQETFGRPEYTTGQQRLDQLLLQATPGQTRELQTGLAGLAGQTQQQLGAFSEEAQARQAALQQLAGQRAEEIQNLLQGGVTEDLEEELGQRGISDIEQALQQKFEQAKETAPEELAAFRQRLEEGELTGEDLSLLGLTPEAQTFGVDIGQFISPEARMPTIAGVASPEEVARYQALSQLAGTAPGIAGLEGEVGGFTPYEARAEDLTGAIGEARGRFAEEFAPTARSIEGFKQARENIPQLAPPGGSLGIGLQQQIGQYLADSGVGVRPELVDEIMKEATRWGKDWSGQNTRYFTQESLQNAIQGVTQKEEQKLMEQALGLAGKRGALSTIGGQELGYEDLLQQFWGDIYGGTGRGGEAVETAPTPGIGKAPIRESDLLKGK